MSYKYSNKKNKRKTYKRKICKRKATTYKRKICKRKICKLKATTYKRKICKRKATTYKRKRYTLGGSRSYNMDTGEYRAVADGKDVFRKLLSTTENNEADIVNFLRRFPEYKDNNIVIFYDITPEYIEMEDLPVKLKNQDNYVVSMRKAKDFLQSIGIMYLDWKPDNIGKSKDGEFKLFDFDASGIANLETNQWIIEPIYFNSYGQDKYLSPKELDDLLFEKNMVERQIPIYDFY